MLIFAREIAGVAQLVEHDLAKVGVAGSSPVSRSGKRGCISSLFFYLHRPAQACLKEVCGNNK